MVTTVLCLLHAKHGATCYTYIVPSVLNFVRQGLNIIFILWIRELREEKVLLLYWWTYNGSGSSAALANSVRDVNTGWFREMLWSPRVVGTWIWDVHHMNLSTSEALEEARSKMAAKNTQGQLWQQPLAARAMFCLRLCANIWVV